MGAHITIATQMLGNKRVGRIVDGKTLDNDATIQEAIDYGFVVGKKEVIGQAVKGVLKAMADGVAKDGNGRKVNELVSLQAYAKGRLDDITDEIDKTKIDVRVVARALKELMPDTTGWSYTVEGSTSGTLSVSSITTGEMIGEIVVGEDVDINGYGLAIGTGDTVKWAVTGTAKSGTVDASKLSGSWTRLTVTGNALAELNDPQYNGKTIVWTLKIGGKTVVKSATLRVNA